jgi:hypothetical protein
MISQNWLKPRWEGNDHQPIELTSRSISFYYKRKGGVDLTHLNQSDAGFILRMMGKKGLPEFQCQ